MIKSKDISVVVQGAITKETSWCINSVKKALPNAEIILSTWEGSDLSSIDLTNIIVVKNKDPNPEGIIYWADFNDSIANNTNRQIISSYNGIKKATRKYVLRMRQDINLLSANFLNFWDKFEKRNDEFAFFKHKILVPSIVSINPEFDNGYFQIQISDWMQFGLREDLEELYNLSLMSEEDMEYYVNNDYELKEGLIDTDSHCKWRWGSEQYIFVSNAKKKLSLMNYPHRKAATKENIGQLKDFFMSNFIVLDNIDYKFDNFKHPIKRMFYAWLDRYDWWEGLYRYNRFQKDYKKYLDEKHKIKLNKYNFMLLKVAIKKKKFKIIVMIIKELWSIRR